MSDNHNSVGVPILDGSGQPQHTAYDTYEQQAVQDSQSGASTVQEYPKCVGYTAGTPDSQPEPIVVNSREEEQAYLAKQNAAQR